MERRLAAIVAIDVAGYSRLMNEDEEGTYRAVKDTFKSLIDPKVAQYRGRIIKRTGDGALMEFASAVDSVAFAVEMQCAMRERNGDVPEERRIAYRVGINIGDIIIEPGDIYGDGVNIAARLEGLADPGGVCIARNVFNQIKNKLDVRFQDMGEQELKNIPEAVRAYRIVMGGEDAGPDVVGKDKPLPLPDKPSIAILPFTNMSGDPEQEYFSDGITDDLITALSNVRSFLVIARQSSFAYKDRSVNVKDIGCELGVRYVMEGSVRKAGNRIRVSAQLIEADTDTHIWADRYDGTLDDIFDLQDKITKSVIGAIEPQLHRAEFERIRQKRPENFDAYDLTLYGLAKMARLTPKDTEEALEYFLSAIESDPNYARAYVCASYCYRRQVQLKGLLLPEKAFAEAIRLAREGLRLDPTDPYVLWQTAMTFALVGQEFDEALALVKRSLSINSASNRAWIASGSVHCFVGAPELAIEHAETAMRLSPLDNSMWVAFWVMATGNLQLGNYKEAADWAKKSIRQHPENLSAIYVLAASLSQSGQEKKAGEAAAELLEFDPDITIGQFANTHPVARYKNLDGFLEGLGKAGLPA